MTESATEVLLPKTKRIFVCGEEVEIRPLSCRAINKALRLMSECAVKIKKSNEDKSDQDVLLEIFQGLDEKVGEMVSIITGIDVEKTREVSLEDVSELAVAIAETNNFGKIFSNFSKAMELSVPKR